MRSKCTFLFVHVFDLVGQDNNQSSKTTTNGAEEMMLPYSEWQVFALTSKLDFRQTYSTLHV